MSDTYPFSHGFSESGRLALQSWLIDSELSYTVHPAILKDIDDKRISVADIGAGNCLWILGACKRRPLDTYVAFDITDENFPQQSTLPKNIRLDRDFDVYGTVPGCLYNQFDFINIRMFAAVVRGGDPSPVLANAMRMLKPGGWLQWTDIDPTSMRVAPYGEPGPKLVKTMTGWIASLEIQSIVFDWMQHTGSAFEQAGFVSVKPSQTESSRMLSKLWTDDLCMAMSDAFMRADKEPQSEKSAAMKAGVKAALEEVKVGALIELRVISTVGKKPV